MQYLVANWKSNKTMQGVVEWAEAFAGFGVPSKTAVVVCPPFLYIPQLYALFSELNVPFEVGGQDVSPFPFGAYTGEVAAEELSEFSRFCIVGHSERRKYFEETHQSVANKVDMCFKAGIQPIVCVDEPYMKQQMAAIDEDYYEKLIVAYEPLTAIGSGEPDTPEHAQEVAEEIVEILGQSIPVLYGGSVNSSNITDFLKMKDIEGALVGGASLKAEEWKEILQRVKLTSESS